MPQHPALNPVTILFHFFFTGLFGKTPAFVSQRSMSPLKPIIRVMDILFQKTRFVKFFSGIKQGGTGSVELPCPPIKIRLSKFFLPV
jgi:hypothetical protein